MEIVHVLIFSQNNKKNWSYWKILIEFVHYFVIKKKIKDLGNKEIIQIQHQYQMKL